MTFGVITRPAMTEPEKKFYITTSIPYVNARPHVGHALEFVQADALARYEQIKGKDVLLLSGSDDNALKNVLAAERAGVPIEQFVGENAQVFLKLLEELGVRFNIFQKGSDKTHHFPSSQKLWKLCEASGDIYKKSYDGLYCVGCEAFYTPDELDEYGECFEHPGRKLDVVSEENYFFRLSKYREKLKNLIETDEVRIVPDSRKNEVLSFLSGSVHDISISRSNERAKSWGVPVPGDDSQRIYVWFDALNIYQSGVGFGWDDEFYKIWWPADVHVIGKGITRFHAVYWLAFLLSAKLSLPKAIFVHGYFTVDGQKMSKTIGNVVDPLDAIKKYGAEPLRYYFFREIPSGGDGDFSFKKIEERYNGELANGLGNLVARVAAFERLSPLNFDRSYLLPHILEETATALANYDKTFVDFRLNEAIAEVWRLIGFTDRYISGERPWAAGMITKSERIITNAAYLVSTIANLLSPFLPETAEKIQEQIAFRDNVLEIKKRGNLFPRLES